MVLMAVSCFATNYTDELVINSKSQGQKTISVDKQLDGKYKIVLKRFSYEGTRVGTITLEDVEAEDDGQGNTMLTTTGQKVTVMLFVIVTVSVDLKGKIVGDKFYADITIHDIPKFGTWYATFAGGLKKAPTTGISNLPVNNDNEKEEIFNLQGQRISEAKPGQVVIVKKGGKAVKVVK